MGIDDKQIGGDHYLRPNATQGHWDFAWQHALDPFQYQITKYVTRWRHKNGVVDLEKAQHFLEKYLKLLSQGHDPYALAEEVAEEVGKDSPQLDIFTDSDDEDDEDNPSRFRQLCEVAESDEFIQAHGAGWLPNCGAPPALGEEYDMLVGNLYMPPEEFVRPIDKMVWDWSNTESEYHVLFYRWTTPKADPITERDILLNHICRSKEFEDEYGLRWVPNHGTVVIEHCEGVLIGNLRSSTTHFIEYPGRLHWDWASKTGQYQILFYRVNPR